MMAAIALTSCLAYPLLTPPLYSVSNIAAQTNTVKHAPSDFMPPPTYCLTYDEPGTNLVNVQVFVCARSDDVEQYEDGTMYIDSTDLEFTWDETEQIIGLRFPGVDIPRNAEIRSATLCFYATRSDVTPTDLFIHGIDDTNPPTFNVIPFDLSRRPRTKQNVRWTPGPWTRDELFESSSCTDLVQHAVNQSGWKPGNAIAFVVDGKGSRTAVTFDGNIHSSPMLKIQYVKPAAN